MMNRLHSLAISWLILGMIFFTAAVSAQDDIRYEFPDGGNDPKTVSAAESVNSLLAVIVVNDDGDATDATPGDGICETSAGNGICTLRAAVTEANALAGTDTIVFDPNITSISVNGQIAITSAMNIIGTGAEMLTIQNIAPLSTTSRVFNITNFVVNLSGMTITGGNLTGNGGAINNIGTLTITNCIIRDNLASSAGGAIRSTNTLNLFNSVVRNNSSTASTSGGVSFAGANLNIANSTIRSNTSFGNGGGMNVSATVSVNISNTTISGNTAGAASGGLFTNRGTITNTTISGNTANGALATEGGGGVRIQAGLNTVSFISCTITNNTAPNTTSGARSGVWHETGTVTFANSVVAANVAQDIQRDGGTLTSNGFNLIGENTSVATEFPAGMPSGTDYVGTDKAPLDPMIGTLDDNGGPTQTHALLTGSIAIDKGNSLGLELDQRNFVRTVDIPEIPNSPTGDGTDIGAFEFQSAANPAGVSVSGRVFESPDRYVSRALVILTDGAGNSRIAFTNSFGFFTFDNVAVGESYIGTVQSKGLVFAPQVITVNNDVAGVVFTAEP